MKWTARCLWMIASVAALLSCATLPGPAQPEPSAPYAVLAFSASMRLLQLDDQPIDARTRLRRLRVTPGRHTLRFVHLNEGADGSAEHAGQRADPFTLDARAGTTYQFESKT